MTMKEYLSHGFTLVLALCAVLVTTLLVLREVRPVSSSDQISSTLVADWSSIEEGIAYEGSSEAPVKIVEYFDYECPYCLSMSATLRQIRQKYPETVQIIYKHLPLQGHLNARPSALASLCAAQQGLFAAYHHKLYGNFHALEAVNFDSLATAVGVPDLGAFKTCLEEQQVEEVIRADEKLAAQLGIQGIPALIVNGRLIKGALPLDQVETLIEDAQRSDLATTTY